MDPEIATEEDDEDLCRICRTTGEEYSPLLYPCACRGSIKFVHLLCFFQWINHSKSLQCEVCKHPYSFSPVYAENAPKRLPFHEFLVGIAMRTCRVMDPFLRRMFIHSVWLLAVPFVTFWIWRLAFVRSFGEAQRLFLSHISPTVIITDCLLGFLLKVLASIVLFFLGENPLKNFLRHFRELGGQEEREDDGGRYGIADLCVHVIRNVFTVVNASNMIFPVGFIFMPFTLGRAILYQVSWIFVAAKGPAVTGLSLEYIAPKSALTVVSSLINKAQENGLLGQLFELMRVSANDLNGANNTLSVAADFLKASAVGVSRLSDVATLTVGYMFIIFLVYLYLGVIALIRYTKGEPSLPRRLLAAMRYLMTMIKVALLVIQLGVFTLMYGWWLDICTVRMFGKTVSDRVQFLSVSPLACSLLHSIVGFVYVGCSSVLKNLLEEVLRPGVWNIPHDSDLDGIQDLINDLSDVGIQDLINDLSEAASDGILIVLVVFLPIKFAIWMAPSSFPLDMSVSDPFAEIPLCMLAFQICIPFILEHFRLRSLLHCWFSGVGWALGLTEFLLPRPEDNIGKDNGNSEQRMQNRAQALQVGGPDRAVDALPAADNPNQSVLPNRNVNTDKEYKDGGELSTAQYIFMLRIILLLLAGWITLLLFNSALIVVPVSLGRVLFKAMPLLPITNGINCNDLHAFVTGTYVFLTIMSGARHAIEHVKSKRTLVLLNQIWKWCGIVIKSSVPVAIWVFIIPVLIGILYELLVIVPIGVPVDESPVFLLYQDWALGLIILKIGTKLVLLDRMLPIVGACWRARFERLREVGFLRLHWLWVLREILLPITINLLRALCVPYILARGVFPMLGYTLLVNSTVYRFAWIGCLSFYLSCFCVKRCLIWFRNLHNSIRDDRYIIGRRIHNFGGADLDNQNQSNSDTGL